MNKTSVHVPHILVVVVVGAVVVVFGPAVVATVTGEATGATGTEPPAARGMMY